MKNQPYGELALAEHAKLNRRETKHTLPCIEVVEAKEILTAATPMDNAQNAARWDCLCRAQCGSLRPAFGGSTL